MAVRKLRGRQALTKRALAFEGIPELKANVSKLIRQLGYSGGDVAREVKQGIMTGALILRDEARSNVHSVSGNLSRAIFAAYGSEKKADVLVGVNTRIAVRTSRSGTKTYAGTVEYGDAHRAPHPYMRPAISATRPIVARIVSDKLVWAIERLTDRL